MSESHASPLDEVRSVLFGAERGEIDELTREVQDLRDHVTHLESLILAAENRSITVGEVLVEAVAQPGHGELARALQGDIEKAVHDSAREDSTIMAEALYPVMGPAMRKMIASLFSLDRGGSGDPFSVEQVLLIERSSGLLLSASASDESSLDDADIVSGMLDAIRLFVQDAFNAQDHDGLRDLRVGDTSVLVEWGPKAVLASVVRGVPTDSYREETAEHLELLHLRFAEELENFDGTVDGFDDAFTPLSDLRTSVQPPQSRQRVAALLVVLCLLLVVALLAIWIA